MSNKYRKLIQYGILTVAVIQALFITCPTLAYAATNSALTNTDPAAHTSQITNDQICEPDQGAGAGHNIDRCIHNIYLFALAFAGSVAVLLFVFAGYLYITGTDHNVTEAKHIMERTIIAIVILLIPYLILNALDPKLANNLPDLSNQQVSCDTGTNGAKVYGLLDCSNLPPSATNVINNGGSPDNNALAANSTAATLAANLLKMDSITVSSSGECPGNNPEVTLQQAAAGNQVIFDGPGSLCNQGKTELSAQMLYALNVIGNARIPITITSLTSGHHASTSDPHYAGRAVDFTFGNLGSDSQKVAQMLASSGSIQFAVECRINGVSQFIVIGPSSALAPGTTKVDASRCINQPNYHWHAKF